MTEHIKLHKFLDDFIKDEDPELAFHKYLVGKMKEVDNDEVAIETACTVRAELTEQWIKERESLVEAIDAKVEEYLEGEMAELHEEIARFRDLGAEYAEALKEAKGEMRDELMEDLENLAAAIGAAALDWIMEVARRGPFNNEVIDK